MKTPLVILVLVSFLVTGVIGPMPVYAQEGIDLPNPGAMVHLSPAFNAPVLKGVTVYPDNPFKFDFILDQGDSLPLAGRAREGEEQLKEESKKLVKYFLSSITTPEKDLWVNLSPYEKNRIIPESFGQTDMGRDLLAEDYILKQITASLIYPEEELGQQFWKRIYEEAQKKFGTTDIPVNTFNKVWIVPDQAKVYEHNNTAFVVKARLKVMLEQDYLALNKSSLPPVGRVREGAQDVNAIGSQIVREIVLPQLEKEINQGKNFAPLRQVYYSLILAVWFKKRMKDSILGRKYVDQNKVTNLSSPNALIGDTEAIYQRYLKAFKKGVYNYIKEESDPVTQEMIPRKYFSGGWQGQIRNIDISKAITPAEQRGVLEETNLQHVAITLASPAMTTSQNSNTSFPQGVIYEREENKQIQRELESARIFLQSKMAEMRNKKELASYKNGILERTYPGAKGGLNVYEFPRKGFFLKFQSEKLRRLRDYLRMRVSLILRLALGSVDWLQTKRIIEKSVVKRILNTIVEFSREQRPGMVPLIFIPGVDDAYWELDLRPYGYKTLSDLEEQDPGFLERNRSLIINAVEHTFRFKDNIWFFHRHLHSGNVLLKTNDQGEVVDIKFIDFKFIEKLDGEDLNTVRNVLSQQQIDFSTLDKLLNGWTLEWRDLRGKRISALDGLSLIGCDLEGASIQGRALRFEFANLKNASIQLEKGPQFPLSFRFANLEGIDIRGLSRDTIVKKDGAKNAPNSLNGYPKDSSEQLAVRERIASEKNPAQPSSPAMNPLTHSSNTALQAQEAIDYLASVPTQNQNLFYARSRFKTVYSRDDYTSILIKEGLLMRTDGERSPRVLGFSWGNDLERKYPQIDHNGIRNDLTLAGDPNYYKFEISGNPLPAGWTMDKLTFPLEAEMREAQNKNPLKTIILRGEGDSFYELTPGPLGLYYSSRLRAELKGKGPAGLILFSDGYSGGLNSNLNQEGDKNSEGVVGVLFFDLKGQASGRLVRPKVLEGHKKLIDWINLFRSVPKPFDSFRVFEINSRKKLTFHTFYVRPKINLSTVDVLPLKVGANLSSYVVHGGNRIEAIVNLYDETPAIGKIFSENYSKIQSFDSYLTGITPAAWKLVNIFRSLRGTRNKKLYRAIYNLAHMAKEQLNERRPTGVVSVGADSLDRLLTLKIPTPNNYSTKESLKGTFADGIAWPGDFNSAQPSQTTDAAMVVQDRDEFLKYLTKDSLTHLVRELLKIIPNRTGEWLTQEWIDRKDLKERIDLEQAFRDISQSRLVYNYFRPRPYTYAQTYGARTPAEVNQFLLEGEYYDAEDPDFIYHGQNKRSFTRGSLNIRITRESIQALDKILKQFPTFTYKLEKPGYGNQRDDAVTIYFFSPPSREVLEAIAAVASEFKRDDRPLLGWKVTDGFWMSETETITTEHVAALRKKYGGNYGAFMTAGKKSEGELYAYKLCYRILGINLEYDKTNGFTLYKIINKDQKGSVKVNLQKGEVKGIRIFTDSNQDEKILLHREDNGTIVVYQPMAFLRTLGGGKGSLATHLLGVGNTDQLNLLDVAIQLKNDGDGLLIQESDKLIGLARSPYDPQPTSLAMNSLTDTDPDPRIMDTLSLLKLDVKPIRRNVNIDGFWQKLFPKLKERTEHRLSKAAQLKINKGKKVGDYPLIDINNTLKSEFANLHIKFYEEGGYQYSGTEQKVDHRFGDGKTISDNIGWKVHLNVTPEDALSVSKYLISNGFFHKFIRNSDTEYGKIFTVYIGSFELAGKLAKQISEDLAGKLAMPIDTREIEFAPGVIGRFDAKIPLFQQYGAYGFNHLDAVATWISEHKHRVSFIVLYKKFGSFFMTDAWLKNEAQLSEADREMKSIAERNGKIETTLKSIQTYGLRSKQTLEEMRRNAGDASLEVFGTSQADDHGADVSFQVFSNKIRNEPDAIFLPNGTSIFHILLERAISPKPGEVHPIAVNTYGLSREQMEERLESGVVFILKPGVVQSTIPQFKPGLFESKSRIRDDNEVKWPGGASAEAISHVLVPHSLERVAREIFPASIEIVPMDERIYDFVPGTYTGISQVKAPDFAKAINSILVKQSTVLVHATPFSALSEVRADLEKRSNPQPTSPAMMHTEENISEVQIQRNGELITHYYADDILKVVNSIERIMEPTAQIIMLPYMWMPSGEYGKNALLEELINDRGGKREVNPKYHGAGAIFTVTKGSFGTQYTLTVTETEQQSIIEGEGAWSRPVNLQGTTRALHVSSLKSALSIIEHGLYAIPERVTFTSERMGADYDYGKIVLVFNLPNEDIVTDERSHHGALQMALRLSDKIGARLPLEVRNAIDSLPNSDLQKDVLRMGDKAGVLAHVDKSRINIKRTLELNRERLKDKAIGTEQMTALEQALSVLEVNGVQIQEEVESSSEVPTQYLTSNQVTEVVREVITKELKARENGGTLSRHEKLEIILNHPNLLTPGGRAFRDKILLNEQFQSVLILGSKRDVWEFTTKLKGSFPEERILITMIQEIPDTLIRNYGFDLPASFAMNTPVITGLSWQNSSVVQALRGHGVMKGANKGKSEVGGIDLTAHRMKLDIDRDKAQISEPMDLKALENIEINSLYIKDIEIKPMTNLPQLLGIAT